MIVNTLKKCIFISFIIFILLMISAFLSGGFNPQNWLNYDPDNYRVGDTVLFGDYTWRVLDVKEGTALLIADDITHIAIPYHEEPIAVTWETCTLRKWLNEEFYNTFNEEEQSRILLTTNKNTDNEWYETEGGNQTDDWIFLLSLFEMVSYFPSSGKLMEKQLYMNDGYISDQYDKERVATYEGEPRWWWLRSPGYYDTEDTYNHQYNAVCIGNYGDIEVFGFDITGRGNVRPALWVKKPNS